MNLRGLLVGFGLVFFATQATEASSIQSVWSGPASSRRIALTFDDGPHPEITEGILDILGASNARATFFVLGDRMASTGEAGRRLLRRMKAEGHEIGNHSLTHRNMASLSSSERVNEIRQVQAMVAKIVGVAPRLFRPPGGNATFPMVRDIAETEIEAIVMWSIDTRDWSDPGRERIWREVEQHAANGSIILMHDTKQGTLEALPLVVDLLEARGFELVTVTELIESGR